MMEIPAIQVFFADPAALVGTDPGAMSCLDAADQAHVARFRFARDREVAAASRILQRLALARALGDEDFDPGCLQFTADSSGRPRVSAPDSMRSWCFSASNTIGLVACAVSRHYGIGLDVERVREELPEDLLSYCCTESERAALADRPVEERGAQFTALWANKEAYLKARGVGLAQAPSRICFMPGVGGSLCVMDDDATGQWQVVPLDVGRGHAAALCVPGVTTPPPVIEVAWARWHVDQIVYSEVSPWPAGSLSSGDKALAPSGDVRN